MRKKTLREISKFASGLVAADFLCAIWLYNSGMLPLSFFGITVTSQGAILGMIFDVILFAILFHFGWRIQERPRTKNEHKFHIIAGIIFTIVALLHLSRIIFQWQLSVGTWEFPYWLNALGVVITAFLAYASFSLS